MKSILINSAILFGWVATTSAATIQFDLMGKGSAGLSSTNETGVVNGLPGFGGETGAGITFDDVTNILTIHVGFGSGNGFGNLTGNATASHLHGPTVSSGIAAFNENASVKYGIDTLPGWNNSATSGGFDGTITILATDVAALMNGRFYMNVHTAANGPGEIRGNLVAVPEPGAMGLLAVTAGLAILRRRRPSQVP